MGQIGCALFSVSPKDHFNLNYLLSAVHVVGMKKSSETETSCLWRSLAEQVLLYSTFDMSL